MPAVTGTDVYGYDVTCDADISEEIARMHSYDKIAYICLLCLWYRGVRM